MNDKIDKYSSNDVRVVAVTTIAIFAMICVVRIVQLQTMRS